MTLFENELEDMTSTAMDLIPQAFPVDSRLLTEFPYGQGTIYRTDIAAVRIDDDALEARAQLTQAPKNVDGSVHFPPLNDEWRYLKSYLRLRRLAAPDDADFYDVVQGDYGPEQSITMDDWKEESAYSSWKANWNWLERHGYVKAGQWTEDDYGFIQKPADVVDVPQHIDAAFAIELKPRDWEKALKQASRAALGTWPTYYLDDPDLFEAIHGQTPDDDRASREGRRPGHGGYADYAVVIMDADHVDDALDHRGRFQTAGVGLASMDRDRIDVHVTPDKLSPPTWSRNRLDLNERTLPTDFKPENLD